MSSKPKSITELISELEAENEALKKLDKLANQYCKMEFDLNVREHHQALERLASYERKAKESNVSYEHKVPENNASQQGQQTKIQQSES